MKRLLTALTLALFVAGSSSVVLADGAASWNKTCAKCHGKDGKGDTKMGKKLGCKDLTDAKVQGELTDAKITDAIKNGVKVDGKKKMKAYGKKFDDAAIAELIKFIRGLKK